VGIRATTGRYQRGYLWDTRGATYGMPRGRTITNWQSVVGVSLGHRAHTQAQDTHTTTHDHTNNPPRSLDNDGRWRGDDAYHHFYFFYLSYHTTHTTRAERRAEKQCRRRGASSGQKTRRGIEGEKPGRRRYREVILREMFLWKTGSSVVKSRCRRRPPAGCRSRSHRRPLPA